MSVPGRQAGPRRTGHKLHVRAAALVLAMSVCPMAHAAIGPLWNGSSGNWNDSFRWTFGFVNSPPNASTNGTINNGEVSVTSGASANGLYIGETGTGLVNLKIQGGNLSVANIYQGYSTANHKITLISSPSSALNVSNTMFVGYQGRGELDFHEGTLNSDTVILGNSPGAYGVALIQNIGPSVVWNNANSIYVGKQGIGYLDVISGPKVNTGGTLHIGSEPGSTGKVEIVGSGSKLTSGAGAIVGGDGTGELRVGGGGVLDTSTTFNIYSIIGGYAGNGSVLVYDSGSAWNNKSGLTVGGGGGTGALTVTNSGAVNIDKDLLVRPGGKISLNNGGNLIVKGDIDVQGSSIGGTGGNLNPTSNHQMNIYSGGQVSLSNGVSVQNFNVNISNGSSLTSKTYYNIASNSQVTVTGGSSFTTNTGDAIFLNWGSYGNANARLWVRSNSTATLNGPLNLGFGNSIASVQSGTIDIDTGGGVTFNNTLYVGTGISGKGTINVDGVGSTGTVTGFTSVILGDNSVGANGAAAINLINGGTFSVNTGTTTINNRGAINVSSGSYFTSNGSATAAGGEINVSAGKLAIQGQLALNGASRLDVTSNGIVEAGTLVMQDDATLAVDFQPNITITSAAILNGELDLSPITQFQLLNLMPIGSSFTVLTAGTLNGTKFDTVNNPTPLTGKSLAVTYTPNSVLVTVAMTGDLDLDGDVDDADFGIAFAAFTGPNNGPSNNVNADLDGDGDVDDADFGIAFAAFTGPGGAGGVPEPGALALIGCGAVVLMRRRR